MSRQAPAIVILGNGSLNTARRIQQCYPQAKIHGLAERVDGADLIYNDFGATVRQLYQHGTPIIALCAAGIVIRTLAPLLLEKGAEPPVLAVAEDASAVVPLLGGLGGVNLTAQLAGTALGVVWALMSGFVVYGVLKMTLGLRLSQEEEFEGADLTIHKITASPDREASW